PTASKPHRNAHRHLINPPDSSSSPRGRVTWTKPSHPGPLHLTLSDMQSPFSLSPEQRLARLAPVNQRVRVVLDTDTFNEVDDQFAVVHALLSPDTMNVEAIYAAPFKNALSTGPA